MQSSLDVLKGIQKICDSLRLDYIMSFTGPTTQALYVGEEGDENLRITFADFREDGKIVVGYGEDSENEIVLGSVDLNRLTNLLKKWSKSPKEDFVKMIKEE